MAGDEVAAVWHRVDPVDVPGDGRVRSVVVDGRTVALARCGLRLGALDNRCPHLAGVRRAACADVRLPRLDRLRVPAVKYGIPVKHVLLNNNALGKIAKEQRAEDFPVPHTSLVNPDWAAYARLCGATGIRVERRDQLDAAMTGMFATDGPVLMCVEQDPELL
jgi:hypothetical protein